MVHGAMYATTPQHIDFCIQTALAANRDMYLWHAGVSNAFAEAERPNQMYHMQYDAVFTSFSGSVFTALSHMRKIERRFKAFVMVPLMAVKPWSTVPCLLQHHNRLSFASRWLSQKIVACIYGTPMCQMPLPKQNVQTRCIICSMTQFSGSGGSGCIRTHLCLQMPLFRSSIIYKDTLKDRACGPLDATPSSSTSISKPQHTHRASTTAHSTMSSSYSFVLLMTSPSRVPSRKRTSCSLTSLN
jgi:hypothetical protein